MLKTLKIALFSAVTGLTLATLAGMIYLAANSPLRASSVLRVPADCMMVDSQMFCIREKGDE